MWCVGCGKGAPEGTLEKRKVEEKAGSKSWENKGLCFLVLFLISQDPLGF